MKSNWRVTSNPIGGEIMYGVYRLLDINEPDHSGNREIYGEYLADKRAAQKIANHLNGVLAEYFTPVAGETYTHRDGGEYFCQKVYNDHSAVFVRKSDGWTMDVYGAQREENGAVSWDYSLRGYFKEA